MADPRSKRSIGTPIEGERIGGEMFDGATEAAIFPGELAGRSRKPCFAATRSRCSAAAEIDYRFVRFRPPVLVRAADGTALPAPHIRLDRALQFLFGDRLT